MSGLLFFWFSWMAWVILTFIMPKNEYRTELSCWLLLIIITSNLYFSFSGITLTVVVFVLLMGGGIWMIKLKRTFAHSLYSFVVMIAFASAQLWEANLPILYINPIFKITPFVLVIIIFFLTKQIQGQLIIGIIGMTFGDILFQYILYGYGLSVDIGGMEFLDELLLTIVLISLLHILVRIRNKIVSIIFNHHLTRWQNE
ncbi:hypothetical protein GLV94_17790 [Virgibacillus halodenitrificans]|uniref:Integral membrane protein n=1 Tax=Virgibacillus halodenitrificans TaxID=1482 RepID=A0ABR7VLM0_VIRHA|nr:hypothetical protein [Virgibacillus halodenitrificans]MBD1222626.1 hypothetical protein [Virgibacillus halodenitrificans]MEC2160378.1 hypothetical protein [Virgibacillus halodenitrificans]MYL47502.1 hypothetical protein [Virgibacillus halodenitrificans]WHX27371.1 hypothetical protein QNH47_05815 [Virgibacillus halodenitrificans]